MKSILLAVVALLAVATITPQADAGNGCFGGNCGAGVNSFGFNGFNGFGFHGQSFGNRPRVQGNNGRFSAGGRALVFVGFDRNGNPVFR